MDLTLKVWRQKNAKSKGQYRRSKSKNQFLHKHFRFSVLIQSRKFRNL